MNVVDVENDACRGAHPGGGDVVGSRMEQRATGKHRRREMREARRVLLPRAALQLDGDAELHEPRGSADGRASGKFRSQTPAD